MIWLCVLTFGALVLLGWRRAVARLIRWRLGGYRREANRPDPSRPLSLASPKSVAVIGGGIAGIAAAETLGSRGYSVTLYEAQPHLGGKLGAWLERLSPDESVPVSHGFHAFFRHYYNLNRFLDRLGLRRSFRAIEDYRILLLNGEELSFCKLDRTPLLNLLSMAERGIYRLSEVLKAPTRDVMGVFLEYDPVRTPAQLDRVSLAEFDRVAQLPPRLKLAFSTFARAFFADEEKLSLAELVKSFHFYYLSHDGGLLYDYPTADYEAALLAPIRRRLEELRVALQLGSPVLSLAKVQPGFLVNSEPFDAVILATDVVGTRELLGNAPGLEQLGPKLTSVRPGQRYAVLRLWLAQASRTTLPVFVVTERGHLVDAIAFIDRVEVEATAWVKANGGSVVELHCYAVPDSVDESQVAPWMLEDLESLLPELRGCTVRHQLLQLRRNFTAFHLGLSSERPLTASGVPRLAFAGDWVKLPFPAMLLEAAFSSGVLAANHILSADGLREEPLESVPLRGLLAGLPESAARQRWSRAWTSRR